MLNDTYVTAEDGTGIVHQAPAFGEDDHRIAIANGILRADEMPPCPVDDSGRFTSQVRDFAGKHVKVRFPSMCPSQNRTLTYIYIALQEADKDIQKVLKQKGRLIVQSTITHSYPFCWRSGTPLIYRAIPVWFVRVTPIIDELVANNKETLW